MRPTVVKVGGSLFGLPDLGPRLRDWLARHVPSPALLVPGGGPTTDVVRDLDRCHGLGQAVAHWLALRALALNAAFLAELLPGAEIAGTVGEWEAIRRSGLPVVVIDPFRFLLEDEARPGRLPHSWAVGSDSVAARVAVVIGAGELVLLKSADPPAGEWSGYVDEGFVVAVGTVRARAVNLRAWTAPA
jgi:aspartokinase-like uncharacterized kinase